MNAHALSFRTCTVSTRLPRQEGSARGLCAPTRRAATVKTRAFFGGLFGGGDKVSPVTTLSHPVFCRAPRRSRPSASDPATGLHYACEMFGAMISRTSYAGEDVLSLPRLNVPTARTAVHGSTAH